MKIRMLSRILGTVLVAGSVFTVSPAAFAEEGAAAPAQAEAVQEQAPFDVKVVEQHVMAKRATSGTSSASSLWDTRKRRLSIGSATMRI